MAFSQHDENITFSTLVLLSGLAGEMGAGIGGIIVKTNMRQLLVQNMQHPSPDIRGASFDLLFELTKSCMDQVIRPHLRKLSLVYWFFTFTLCCYNNYISYI